MKLIPAMSEYGAYRPLLDVEIVGVELNGVQDALDLAAKIVNHTSDYTAPDLDRYPLLLGALAEAHKASEQHNAVMKFQGRLLQCIYSGLSANDIGDNPFSIKSEIGLSAEIWNDILTPGGMKAIPSIMDKKWPKVAGLIPGSIPGSIYNDGFGPRNFVDVMDPKAVDKPEAHPYIQILTDDYNHDKGNRRFGSERLQSNDHNRIKFPINPIDSQNTK